MCYGKPSLCVEGRLRCTALDGYTTYSCYDFARYLHASYPYVSPEQFREYIHNMLKLGRNGKKLYNTHSRIDKDCLNGASNFEEMIYCLFSNNMSDHVLLYKGLTPKVI